MSDLSEDTGQQIGSETQPPPAAAYAALNATGNGDDTSELPSTGDAATSGEDPQQTTAPLVVAQNHWGCPALTDRADVLLRLPA